MHWVKDFYGFQRNVLRESSMEDWKPKIELIKKNGVKPLSQILELGGGAGEFAVLAANNKYTTTMIDIVAENVKKAKNLKEKHEARNLEIFQGDFYEINDLEKFDAICYWDGFGIGEDEDQVRLLNIMYKALKPKGLAFIDFYPVGFWKQQQKKEFWFDKETGRGYDYDLENNKMIDCWWTNSKLTQYCQYLKCYNTVEIEALIKQTPFTLKIIEPGERFNPQNFEKMEGKSFDECISNTLILIKN